VQIIKPADGSSLVLAWLYQVWRDKSKPDDDPERVVPSSPATRLEGNSPSSKGCAR
jgi:hypothetical protein